MTAVHPSVTDGDREPARNRAGFDVRVVELTGRLRAEGLAIGTSELMDALAALEHVSWRSREEFHGALAATLAKSPEDRRIFDLVFDAYLDRQVEGEALRLPASAAAAPENFEYAEGVPAIDLRELRERIARALREGDESALRDLARLTVATLGRLRSGSGVLGVDVQRIRRELDLTGELHGRGQHGDAPPPDNHGTLSREQARHFDALIRRELQHAQIQRTGRLPASRPLTELARALPTGPSADLAAVHRVVAQLRRRLASQGHELRGSHRHAHVDVRRTMRASLQTGGVPVDVRYRPQRPRRPELFVICDVSTSVSSASVFFLSVLHALHDSFRRMRSFVFVERISEVTDLFAREKSFSAVSEAISRDAGVVDVSGYTDYGRVWSELLSLAGEQLHPGATLIVLGDARANGRDPGIAAFEALAERAGRAFWLNPEPRLYWNHGDSVIGAYEPHCRVHECWSATHLEDFVKELTRQPR